MKDYLIQGETLRDIADAIREKTGSSEPMEVKDMADNINSIGTGIELPELDNEGTAEDMLAGKQLINSQGSIVTGVIQTQAAKTVTPGANAQIVVAKNVYTTGEITVEAIPSNYEDVNAEVTEYTSNLELLEEAIAELEAAVNVLSQ